MPALQVPAVIAEALDAQWRLLSGPGTWWTGEQRVAMAAATRRSDANGESGALPEDVADVSWRIAADVHSITASRISELEAAGVERPAYTEILGVVARVVAVDSFLYGIGASVRPLPEPVAGDPARSPNLRAEDNGAWIPTEGRPGATSSLTAVPAESAARLDLSRALYIDDQDVGDWRAANELMRPQMELVAARTSLLNECFY